MIIKLNSMAAADLFNEYTAIPAVTRFYTTACVGTTLAVQLEFISPFQLYFNPDLILYRYQVTNSLFLIKVKSLFRENVAFLREIFANPPV